MKENFKINYYVQKEITRENCIIFITNSTFSCIEVFLIEA